MPRWEPDAAGRLIKAAIDLVRRTGIRGDDCRRDRRAAGLTKRTFFRYFSDKREVLFSGSEEFERVWLEARCRRAAGRDARWPR